VRIVTLCVPLGLVACSVPNIDERVVEQKVWGGCTEPDFCGTNSPLMTAYGTWEFNFVGQPNNQGIVVLGLGKVDQFYTLRVEDSRIFGIDYDGNYLEHQDLVGARIYLEENGRQSAIVIADVGTVDEVVQGGQPIETYVLDWALVIDHPLPGPVSPQPPFKGGEPIVEPVLDVPESVCPPPRWIEETYVGSMWEWDESFFAGMSPYHSVVFEGDRFDPTRRTVQPWADNDWFNIGCGTNTLAKLRLTRNTINTAPKWQYAQAALKMLSADYCGTGRAFTFPGEPLVWRDVTAMDYLHISPNHDLEARWDETGAQCLSSPRLARSDNPAAQKVPDWMELIVNECDKVNKVLLKCKNPEPLTWDGELVTSVNYD
jgi:hypothetical protein